VFDAHFMIWLMNFASAVIMLDLFAQILLQEKKDWGANMLQVLIFVFAGLLFVQVYWL
jgi:hypothetical protein